MKGNYRISQKAIEDLEQIWLYTPEQWSEEQADRYYGLIIDKIESICIEVESGKEMCHIQLNCRASNVKSHLIFYKKASDGMIEIIRVLHQRMDVENRLG